MNNDEIDRLNALLDARNIKLMEREVELFEQFEELSAQKEELNAAIDEMTHINKQLFERNNELNQILYRTSHDLIGPVVSIQGIINIIESENIPDNLRLYLSHIRDKNSQMKGFMQALSTLANITEHNRSFEEINVFQTVKKCMEELRSLPNFAVLNFQIDVENDLIICIDKLIFVTVIKNLVSNAIIFRNKNTNSGYVKIKVRLNNKKVIVTVEDDGEGISIKIFDRIFDMFFRGSLNSIGMGIGLYTIKKITQKMNGNITWNSENGITIFEVELTLI